MTLKDENILLNKLYWLIYPGDKSGEEVSKIALPIANEVLDQYRYTSFFNNDIGHTIKSTQKNYDWKRKYKTIDEFHEAVTHQAYLSRHDMDEKTLLNDSISPVKPKQGITR